MVQKHPQLDDLTETRVIRAPDGLDYLVPLNLYYWNCLEKMEEEGWTDLPEVIGIAWRGREANIRQGLCSDFTFCLNVAINEMFEHYLTRVCGYANG